MAATVFKDTCDSFHGNSYNRLSGNYSAVAIVFLEFTIQLQQSSCNSYNSLHEIVKIISME